MMAIKLMYRELRPAEWKRLVPQSDLALWADSVGASDAPRRRFAGCPASQKQVAAGTRNLDGVPIQNNVNF